MVQHMSRFFRSKSRFLASEPCAFLEKKQWTPKYTNLVRQCTWNDYGMQANFTLPCSGRVFSWGVSFQRPLSMGAVDAFAVAVRYRNLLLNEECSPAPGITRSCLATLCKRPNVVHCPWSCFRPKQTFSTPKNQRKGHLSAEFKIFLQLSSRPRVSFECEKEGDSKLAVLLLKKKKKKLVLR